MPYSSRYTQWRSYVPVAQRRNRAQREVSKLEKKGRRCDPVVVGGRKIARTFWGASWCENLESYSDYANRLPRGRTYVRNGSVVDLQVRVGKITALVAGSELYEVGVQIERAPAKLWRSLTERCAGRVDSVVELLTGHISDGVMGLLADPDGGLFPKPREMKLQCSCPDWAVMCKHVAAALYGVGVRLDERPELLFELRDVDPLDLAAAAGTTDALVNVPNESGATVLDSDDLGGLFEIELDDQPAPRGSRKQSRARVKPKSTPKPKPRPKSKAESKAKPRSTPKSKAKPKSATCNILKVRKGRKLTNADLNALGVPRTTFQNWFALGVLERTPTRGLYRATSETRRFIERALARRKRS